MGDEASALVGLASTTITIVAAAIALVITRSTHAGQYESSISDEDLPLSVLWQRFIYRTPFWTEDTACFQPLLQDLQ